MKAKGSIGATADADVRDGRWPGRGRARQASEVSVIDLTRLRALTLWPEWCPAITHLDKRTENRTWHTQSAGLRLPTNLALHAGASVGGSGCRDQMAAVQSVLNVAEEAGWRAGSGSGAFVERGADRVALNRFYFPVRSAIVAIVRVVGCDTENRTPWDMEGQFHWRIADVHPLAKPVPCRGSQGCWYVPLDVVSEINRQLH